MTANDTFNTSLKFWGWVNQSLAIDTNPTAIPIPNIPIGKTLEVQIVWGAVNSTSRSFVATLNGVNYTTQALGSVGTATHITLLQLSRVDANSVNVSASGLTSTNQIAWTASANRAYVENTPLLIEYTAASSSDRGYPYHANMTLY